MKKCLSARSHGGIFLAETPSPVESNLCQVDTQKKSVELVTLQQEWKATLKKQRVW